MTVPAPIKSSSDVRPNGPAIARHGRLYMNHRGTCWLEGAKLTTTNAKCCGAPCGTNRIAWSGTQRLCGRPASGIMGIATSHTSSIWRDASATPNTPTSLWTDALATSCASHSGLETPTSSSLHSAASRPLPAIQRALLEGGKCGGSSVFWNS